MTDGGGHRKASVKVRPSVWTTDPATGETIIRPRKELLARQNKTAGRVAALDELHKQLAVATEVFLHRGDGGREGVYDATCALTAYLTSQGIPYAALEPLIAVQTAIVDADHGTASALFTPSRTPKGGKPPASDMQRAFEGKMAIVMECCVRHCKAEGKRPYIEPAAKLAAKMINESEWRVKVAARELVELRERIQQAGADSMDRVQVAIAFKSGLAKQYPLEWAKALLSQGLVNPPAKLSG